jgi:hypothetical protein
MIRTLTFTETAAGVTYTAFTSVPPGCRILDVLVETDAAWTAATAALDIGDSDASDALANAYDITAVGYVNSAGGPLGGTAWGDAGGGGGPYSNSGSGKLYPSGDIITAVVTAGTPGGPTGISRVCLLIEQVPLLRRATVV